MLRTFLFDTTYNKNILNCLLSCCAFLKTSCNLWDFYNHKSSSFKTLFIKISNLATKAILTPLIVAINLSLSANYVAPTTGLHLHQLTAQAVPDTYNKEKTYSKHSLINRKLYLNYIVKSFRRKEEPHYSKLGKE